MAAIISPFQVGGGYEPVNRAGIEKRGAISYARMSILVPREAGWIDADQS